MRLSLFTLAGSLFLASFSRADDPSAVLSNFFNTPPTVTGSQLTALATALLSVQSTWTNSPQFTSAVQAIVQAAPSSDLTKIATLNYAQITALPWWTSVPPSAQSVVAAEISAENDVTKKIIGSGAGRTSSPRELGTLMAMSVAFLGFLGVMVAL